MILLPNIDCGLALFEYSYVINLERKRKQEKEAIRNGVPFDDVIVYFRISCADSRGLLPATTDATPTNSVAHTITLLLFCFDVFTFYF